jgi:hypothetical protein
MKKISISCAVFLLGIGFVTSSYAIPLGVTNLLQNASFESYAASGGFANWTEGGEWYRDSRAYDGSFSARLGVENGSLYQGFVIPEGDALYFGAYFAFISNYEGTVGGNWDQAQINMQITGLPNTTIGGSVSNFADLVWSPITGTTNYISNWFLVSGMVDITGIVLPANSAMNINLQNFSSPTTRLLVDAAYAGVSVPEPATFLLLGAGLAMLGLIGHRRRKSS